MFSALLRRTYNAVVNTGNIRYAVYPAISDVDMTLPGVKLTSATAKKMDAAAAAIITSGTSPQVEYWICSILMHTVKTAEIHAVELQNAAAAKLWDCFINITASTVNLPPYELPFPIRMDAKAVVNGILGGVSAAETAYVALICATLL